MLDGELAERGQHDSPIRLRNDRKPTQIGGAAHHDDILHLEGEGKAMRLGDVGESCGSLPLVELEDVLSVEQNRSFHRVDEVEDGFQDGRLPASVRADDALELSLLQAEAHIVNDHLIGAVTGLQMGNLEHQFHPLELWWKMSVKKGTPSRAVRMPIGISIERRQRAKSSTTRR